MTFDSSTRQPCIVQPTPPIDPRCADPAFALSNPLICATTGTLIIRPSLALICELESIQFRVFEYLNTTEVEVTEDCTFSTSNVNVFAIGVNGGAGTGLTDGVVNITATRASDGKVARATVTVLPGTSDCCDDQSVVSGVVVDASRSMSTDFNGATGGDYQSRLAYAKAVATAFSRNIVTVEGVPKDSIKVWSLAEEITDESLAYETDESELATQIDDIEQSLDDTDLLLAVTTAAEDLLTQPADRRILLIISDGQHNTNQDFQAILDAATDFKNEGGIIITIGVRASGSGYDLLERMASVGFFLNGLISNHADVIAWLLYWKDLLCAGDCIPAGDTYVNSPELEASSLDNWEIVDGMVHLLGPGLLDLLPGNGLYLDMAGGSPATIRTIDTFDLTAGSTYRVTFKLAGNQRVAIAEQAVKVYLRDVTAVDGDPNVFEAIVSAPFDQEFNSHSFAFTNLADVTVRLFFEQQFTEGEPPIMGNLLDGVKLENTDSLQVLFEDDFDDENLTYIPPRCGPSAAREPIDNPPAPEVELVTTSAFEGPPTGGYYKYTYGYSWVTESGETAITPVVYTPGTAAPDAPEYRGAQRRITLDNPPDGVTAVRIWRSLGEEGTLTVSNAGDATVNGDYIHQGDGGVWQQDGGTHQIIFVDTGFTTFYKLVDQSAPAFILYSINESDFPDIDAWSNPNAPLPLPISVFNAFDPDAQEAEMFLLAELPPSQTIYLDEDSPAEFEARYDDSVTAPTFNSTGFDEGELGFGYEYCCQYGDYADFAEPIPGSPGTPDIEVDLIPVMTGPTTPSGAASASSEESATFAAWKAFDGNFFTLWESDFEGAMPQEIIYQFPAPTEIDAYSFIGGGAVTVPKAFTFEGSNDGVSWTVLDTQNAVFPAGVEQHFSIAPVTFTYYKMNITQTNGAHNFVALNMLQVHVTVPGQPAEPGSEPPPAFPTEFACQDCLDDVTVQLPDPEAVPDIEDPTAPVVTFTSNKTACFECPEGFLAISTDSTDTTFTTLTNIAAGAGPWSQIVKMDDPTAIVGHYVIQAYEADNELCGPRDFLFQGTNDEGAATDDPGTVWVTLDTEANEPWIPGMIRQYYLQNQSTAYKYYRLYITAFDCGDGTVDAAFNSLPTDLAFLYPKGTRRTCIGATADSQVSRSHADQLAFAAALEGATAAFDARNQCVPAYTRTVTYNAECVADGESGTGTAVASATYTSIISETHALDQAQALAQIAAVDALECE